MLFKNIHTLCMFSPFVIVKITYWSSVEISVKKKQLLMQLIITVTYSSLSEAKVTEGYVIYWSYCATLRCSCGRTAGGRDTVFLLCRLSVWFIHTTSGSHNVAVTATAVPTFDSGPMYTKTMCCNDGRISQLCSFLSLCFFFLSET